MRFDTVTDIDKLHSLIDDATQRAQRPRLVPREALAQGIQSLLGGVGVGCAAWATLAYFGIGNGMEAGAFAGVLFFGASLGLRSIADEGVDLYRLNKIKKAAKEDHKRLGLALDAIDELSESLTQMTHERDLALYQRDHAREATQGRYVAPRDDTAQDVQDATRILRYWYEAEKYLSRREASSHGISDPRHRDAQKLLTDAGLIAINGPSVKFLPASFTDAITQLNQFLVRTGAKASPLTPERNSDYVE